MATSAANSSLRSFFDALAAYVKHFVVALDFRFFDDLDRALDCTAYVDAMLARDRSNKSKVRLLAPAISCCRFERIGAYG